MKNIFKKITNINYNGKIFTIFVDENHRFTFLERNQEGKYFYPKIEDYKALNDIYNKKNPFILNSVKKYRFIEKVNLGIAIATVGITLTSLGLSTANIISMYTNESETIEETNDEAKEIKEVKEINNFDYLSSYQNWNVNVTDEQVEVTNEVPTMDYHAIESLDELDEILGITSVTIEDIEEAIKSNDKLDEYLKEIVHNLAVSIYQNNPDADLRIFCYHAKDIESVPMSKEDYKEKFHDYSRGRYDPRENKFYYIIGSEEATLYHEIAHSIISFWIEKDGIIYFHNYASASAINEVFNNKIVNYVMPTVSYSEETQVVDYLLTFTEFDFNRFNEEGASYILYDIHKQYPNVDIFYINDCLEVMKANAVELDEYTNVEDSPELLDELFCLCKERINVNREEGYGPFLDFANLITTNEEAFNKYFNEYNEYLESLQLDVISEEKFEFYNNISGFILKEDMLYPYVDDVETGDAMMIVDGDYQKTSIIGEVFFPINHLIVNIKKELLSNPNSQFDSEFWKIFLIKYDYLDASYLYKTKVMLNGNTLVDDNLYGYSIQIGLNSQNEIGFIIRNYYEEIIYQSDENLRNKSNNIWLTSYYSFNIDNVGKLELTDILNEEYLLKIQNKDNLFANLIIEDNEYILEPSYFMYVNSNKGGIYGLKLNNVLIIGSNTEEFDISLNYICMNIALPDDEPLHLRDILNYNGILDEDTLEYHFTEDEIRELVTNYLEEMKNNKTR